MSDGGILIDRVERVGWVVLVAALGLFATQFLPFVEMGMVLIVLLITLGVLLGVAYLFNSKESSYDASTTGLKTRNVDEEITLSTEDKCFVCQDDSGTGIRHHDFDELVLRGHPLVEKNHKTTVYCDEHYAEADRLVELNRQFDHERNKEIQEEIFDNH